MANAVTASLHIHTRDIVSYLARMDHTRLIRI